MTLTTDIRNERRVITTNPMDIKRTKREHYESTNLINFGLGKIDQFLETGNLPEFMQEQQSE